MAVDYVAGGREEAAYGRVRGLFGWCKQSSPHGFRFETCLRNPYNWERTRSQLLRPRYAVRNAIANISGGGAYAFAGKCVTLQAI